jgi:hypothetical protein
MRKIYLLLLVVVLMSCRQEEEQIPYALYMTKDACLKNIYDNEYKLKEIEGILSVGQMRRADSLLLAESKRYVMWRRNFIKEKTVEGLFQYADSVEASFTKWNNWYHPPLDDLKQRLLASNDSVDFYTLLYFATAGERDLLVNMYQKLGAQCKFWDPDISSFRDKEIYQPSETVYLTLSTSEVYRGSLQLDFSDVTCKLKGSNTTIQPEVVQSGPYFVLMYKPTEAGEYTIEGEVKVLHEGNYPMLGRLKNSFSVEKSPKRELATVQRL